MPKTTCSHCKYFREGRPENQIYPKTGHWCSNSRSPFFGLGVHGHEGCGFGERMGRASRGLSTSFMRKRGSNEIQNAL